MKLVVHTLLPEETGFLHANRPEGQAEETRFLLALLRRLQRIDGGQEDRVVQHRVIVQRALHHDHIRGAILRADRQIDLRDRDLGGIEVPRVPLADRVPVFSNLTL